MVWHLDPRSVILIGSLATWLTAGLLWLSWRSLPAPVRPSLRWWLAGVALHPLGFLLSSLRGWVPGLLSIALAATLISAAFGCLAIALRSFYRLPERRVRLLVTTILTAASGVAFSLVWPDEQARIVASHALFAVMIGSSARAVFRRGGPKGRVPLLTGWMFAAVTVLVSLRGAVELFSPMSSAELVAPTALNLACLLGLLMLPNLASVSFLLMCTERAQEQIERTARIDYLTGIYNRRAIEELAARAISAARRHGTPLSVVAVDVDHFKRVNDMHGHECGDNALVEAVRRMQQALRAEDLLGRQGGEEFVAVMPGVTPEEALAAAERLREDFAGRVMRLDDGAGEVEVQLTLSLGVAVLEAGDQQFSHLLRRADRAMYAAKAAGRNRVVRDGAGT